MPEYITKLLQRLHIPLEGVQTYSPAPYTFVPHGKQNAAPIQEETIILSEDRTKFIQRVVGCIQFYVRSIDSTMLCDVNRLSSQQSTPTSATESKTNRLLAYAAISISISCSPEISFQKIRYDITNHF